MSALYSLMGRLTAASEFTKKQISDILTPIISPERYLINQQSSGFNLSIFTSDIDLIEIVATLESAGFQVETETFLLQISGMTCISCIAYVQGAFEDACGVIEVDVNLRDGQALIKCLASSLERDALEKVLEKSSYRVTKIVKQLSNIGMR